MSVAVSEEVTLVIDEALVFTAELEGLRLRANLPRPKVTIRAEVSRAPRVCGRPTPRAVTGMPSGSFLTAEFR